ncbi:MAG: hypothetical protein M1822_004104 [Bathelium mastoideum]|nr:MAG: hypothetical protein M1822_004104 [Bathelium mastoideum]
MDESKDEVRALEEGLCLDPEKSPTSPTSFSLSTTTKSLQKTQLTEGERELIFPCAAVGSCPKGYPNLATFLDSDENFMVYRRFGYLQSRLLLEKQDELHKLEKKLDSMENYYLDKTANPLVLQTRDLTEEEGAPQRAVLFKQIEERFREYSTLLVAAQHLVSFNKPASGDYRSVVNYMKEVGPVIQKEGEWVRHLEDLVTLRSGREHAWLDSGIEHLLKFLQQKLGLKKIIEVSN